MMWYPWFTYTVLFIWRHCVTKNKAMASVEILYVWTLIMIFLIEECFCNNTKKEFGMSTDVSVLETLSLTCYEESSMRSTLESSVACSNQESCRGLSRPNHMCECSQEPTLRQWQSNTFWQQIHLWIPEVSLPGKHHSIYSWWRHQMKIFFALLAICAGNSLFTGEFSAQRPVIRSFDVFLDLRLNELLSKQSRGWWYDAIAPIMASQ